MKVYVVVPTYNEVDNIEKLTEELFKLDLDLEIIVVDDSSPDGTSQKVEGLRQQQKRLHLMTRLGKGGRGGACMAGFQWVFDQDPADDTVVVEMDADLSHDPEDLPRLLEVLRTHDMAIGSRYCEGGAIRNWPWIRTTLSKWANRFAQLVLGIPITDYTTGFRAYTMPVLRSLNYSVIHARGYIVLTEMAYQIHNNGFSIGEAPITFVNRIRGESNLSLSEISSAFLGVMRLKWGHLMKRL